ncbi:MAG: phosphate starvation-inducible protein PhoH [Candidatus Azotimanducaceae bacterium]
MRLSFLRPIFDTVALRQPLAYLRRKTFAANTFVILEEAQNTSLAQLEMFLTRIGEGCQVVVNGEVEQSDIRALKGLVGYQIDLYESKSETDCEV